MWLFTKYGFYSVVCARQGDGAAGAPIDRDRMMIRARSNEHLQRLKWRFYPLLLDYPILENAGTDYRYRIIIPESLWVAIAHDLAAEIDYDNFKAAVERHEPTRTLYQRTLGKVWEMMRGLQG